MDRWVADQHKATLQRPEAEYDARGCRTVLLTPHACQQSNTSIMLLRAGGMLVAAMMMCAAAYSG
jgi:hypothetical protein